MKKLNVLTFSLIAILFASCTLVKSPQTASFQRVKYNTHLKLAKTEKSDKLEKVKSEQIAEVNTEIDSKEMAYIVNKEFNIENELPKQKVLKKKDVEINTYQVAQNEEASLEIKATPKSNSLQASTSVVLEPVASSTTAGLGDILYVILVVLLILIVIGLIAELAGGLVGALIAILLILLILRLLGAV